MYYYIMEPPRRGLSSWQEKIKTILGELGIAGEMVSPSSARTIEELTTLGIVKGYSTIVAVGSEKVANEVASAIIKHKETENSDSVLGFIPDDYESPLAELIGVKDFKEACNALKFRKLETADTILIEPNQYILTELKIEESKPFKIDMAFDSFKLNFPANRIVIKPGLDIEINDLSWQNQPVVGFFNWLVGKKEKDIYSSFFTAESLKLGINSNPQEVKVGGVTINKTPIVLKNMPKALKIIVTRDTIGNQSK